MNRICTFTLYHMLYIVNYIHLTVKFYRNINTSVRRPPYIKSALNVTESISSLVKLVNTCEIRRACCGHWLLMNTLQILNVFLQLKWNQKVKLFLNRCSVSSKKLRHIFYGSLIDCDFWIWICSISGNIYYFFYFTACDSRPVIFPVFA